MAVRDIRKILIFGLKSREDAVLEILQQLAAVQIEPVSPEQNVKEEAANSENFHKAEFCLNFLKPLSKPRGMLESLSEEPKTRDFSWIRNMAHGFQLDSLFRELKGSETRIREIDRQEKELRNNLEILKRYENYNVELSEFRQIRKIRPVLCGIESKLYSDLEEKLGEILCTWKIVSRDGKNLYLSLLVYKDEEKKLLDVLSQFGAVIDKLPVSEGTVPSEINKTEAVLSTLSEEKKKIFQEMARYTEELENLETVYDYHASLKLREASRGNLLTTKYTFILKAYVPEDKIGCLKKALSSEPSVEIEITEIGPDEEYPVILENPVFVSPIETVTSLYGLPNRNEYDPTPLLGAFFLLFFGVCLTDAAYGVILALMTFTLIRFLKMQGGMKKLFTLLFYGGIWTIFIGAAAGGWFGVSPEKLPGFLKKIMFINPAEQVLDFLIISLLLGVTQLVFGILVRAYRNFQRGNIAAFLFDDLLWAIYISGITAYLFTSSLVLKNLVLASVVLIVCTNGRSYSHKNIVLSLLMKFGGGLLGLYGTMGFLGDVLSYCRLMALGLATGGIAMVINLLGGMIHQSIPIVGIVLAVIFLSVGHVANVIMNVLGAFIHSARLQYVEFFPKFFEGGGKPFRPFCFRFRKVIISNSLEEA